MEQKRKKQELIKQEAKSKMPSKKKLTFVDTEFENALNDFIQAVLAQEKTTYHNSLEPFEVYAQKLTLELKENMYLFRQKFMRGYAILLEELQKNPPTS